MLINEKKDLKFKNKDLKREIKDLKRENKNLKSKLRKQEELVELYESRKYVRVVNKVKKLF